MPHSPAPPATARAITHVALQGDVVVARARHGAGIAALILSLLLRLLARTQAGWDFPPQHHDNPAPAPHALAMPTMGRAPHAAVIEAGLVPDWILPGIRNRGMRPAAPPKRLPRRPPPARAPPIHVPISRRNHPPLRGRRPAPHIVELSQQNHRRPAHSTNAPPFAKTTRS